MTQPRKKILILSARGRRSFTADQTRRLRTAADIRFHACPTPSSAREVARLCATADVIATTPRATPDIGAALLQELPHLKGIAVFSTGLEWVDLRELQKHRILLSYLPGYAAVSVAEHALGLLLAMSRRIHLSRDRMRGFAPASASLRGWELNGKTLGIIGYGRIGRRVSSRARAFGMRILFHDPEKEGSLPLRNLLRRCDAAVLAAPLGRGARPILGEEELRAVRPGLCLVNVGRPGLVDETAVLKSLRRKRLSGYALDGDLETPPHLRKVEPGRLLLTAHTAWYSTEALVRGMEEWTRNIIGMAKGRPRNLFQP
jgi:phosphoglycerate dehydrogenase-like enzyme